MTQAVIQESECRSLTKKEIMSYQEDGVVHVKSIINSEWISSTLELIEELMNKPSKWASDSNPDSNRGRFFHDRYLWPHNEGFRNFVFYSGIAKVAAQAMLSNTVRIYFDHVFVKEPETDEPFMWHQDLPYWPFKGKQICSVWLALADATAETSALEFVKGSHKWGKRYKPVLPGEGSEELSKWIGKSDEGEVCPDFNLLRDKYDIISFDIKEGDALIFNTEIIHSSRGNASKTQRRIAISTRWLGEDACWDPKPGVDPIVSQEDVNLLPGDPAYKDKNAFPLVWMKK